MQFPHSINKFYYSLSIFLITTNYCFKPHYKSFANKIGTFWFTIKYVRCLFNFWTSYKVKMLNPSYSIFQVVKNPAIMQCPTILQTLEKYIDTEIRMYFLKLLLIVTTFWKFPVYFERSIQVFLCPVVWTRATEILINCCLAHSESIFHDLLSNRHKAKHL